MQQPRKYAKPEFERRFLLERLPDEVSDPVRIRDRYLHHSRLRLRVIEDLGGAVLRRKLGHMTRANPNDPRRDLHTSLYLNEREFDLISSLPGDDLVKVRYRHAEIPFALVDFIEEPQPGVTLLEVSFPETISMELFMPPPSVGTEVTDDESYTGRGLARRISPDARPTPARGGTGTDQPDS